jgi:hypothetical protein
VPFSQKLPFLIAAPLAELTMDSPLAPKKKIDYEALHSALMRIPHMHISVARSLINIGIRESYDLFGRDPSSLLAEMPTIEGWSREDQLSYLRMAVYYAENDCPEASHLNPTFWKQQPIDYAGY